MGQSDLVANNMSESFQLELWGTAFLSILPLRRLWAVPAIPGLVSKFPSRRNLLYGEMFGNMFGVGSDLFPQPGVHRWSKPRGMAALGSIPSTQMLPLYWPLVQSLVM